MLGLRRNGSDWAACPFIGPYLNPYKLGQTQSNLRVWRKIKIVKWHPRKLIRNWGLIV